MRIRTNDGKKNLIGKKLIALRQKYGYSQRDLAAKLQIIGYNLDKNVITRIETDKRYVSDMELKGICEVFHISSDELLELNPTNITCHSEEYNDEES